MRKTGLMACFLGLLLAGCGEPTPMQKLKSDVVYADMNNAFWAKEHDKNTPLWNEALSFCKTHEEKPNCGTLMNFYIISNGSTKAPPIGHSGSEIHLPNF